MECPACHSPLIADAAFCPRCGAHIDGAPRYDEYAYEAFISYKHHKRDGALAKRIQRAIEGRRLPRDIGGNRAGERLGKCFRDEDELHSSDSLPALIEDALKHARYLIVICSPEMRASAWVAREVELFASYHGRDRILPVLAEGEPADSFPPLLMTRLEPEGDAYVERPAEPLAADMRDSSYKHFSAEVLRLVAPIAGCGYDDLRQRERTRRLTRIAVGAAAAAVVAAGFGAFALFQQTQIQANLNAALKNESEYLAEEATTILEQGDRLQAVQVALHALGDGEGVNRPYTPSARLALEEACQVYPGNYWRPVYANYEKSAFRDDNITVSDSGSYYAVGFWDDATRVYDVATGLATCEIEGSSKETRICAPAFAGETLLAAYTDGGVEGYDPTTGERLFRVEMSLDRESYVYPQLITPSPDGSMVMVTSFSSSSPATIQIALIDVAAGSLQATWDLPCEAALGDYEYSSIDPFSASFSEDGNTFVQSLGTQVAMFDRSQSAWTTHPVDSGVISDIRIEDALYLATFEEHDAGSRFHIERYDLETLSCSWSHDLDAITTSNYEDVALPILAHTVEHEESRLLPIAYNDRISYLSCQDGSVALDIPTGGQVETFTHATEGVSLCYVSSGRISTFYSPFDLGDIASLGVTNSSRPTSGPSLYGEEDATGAAGIKLFSSGDETYCLLANESERRILVYRYDRDQEKLPERTKLDEDIHAACDDETMLRSASGAYRAVLDYDTDTITCFDGNTFEVTATTSLADLCALANVDDKTIVAECAFSSEREELLYVVLNSNLLVALDAATGKVVGGPVESTLLHLENFAEQDGELVYIDRTFDVDSLKDIFQLVHLDATSLEERSRSTIQFDKTMEIFTIDELETVGTRAVVRWNGNNTNRVMVIDMQSGTPVDAGISRNLDNSHREQTFLADEAHERLMFGIDDIITLYDSNLDELWSYRIDGASWSYANFIPGGDVIAQSDTGELIWLDGDTGAVIARTTTLPDSITINHIWASDDGEHLYAEGFSFALSINLDPHAFDIESYIPCCKAQSKDGQSVLICDSFNAYTLPTYTTDELIDYAQRLIEGHELTREEQRRYHIE